MHLRIRRLALLLLLPTLLMGWVLGSSSGLSAVAALLRAASGERLTLTQAEGRLLGPMRFSRLEWRDGAQELTVEAPTLDWSPTALLRGELQLQSLTAAALHFHPGPADPASDSAAPALPQLPLAVRLQQLHTGPIRIGPATEPVLQSLSLQELTLENRTLNLAQFCTAGNDFLASGRASLSDAQQLDAQVRLETRIGAHPLQADAQVHGPLSALTLQAHAQVGEARAQVDGLLNLQATSPLQQLVATVQALDPAALAEGAPHALLAATLHLQSTDANGLEGSFRVDNPENAPLDHQRLPLHYIQGQLQWRDARLTLSPLDIGLSGGGVLAGQGSWLENTLTLKLDAHALNPAAIDQRLRPMQLTGPLELHLSPEHQQLQLALRDPQLQLDARLDRHEGQITLEKAELRRGKARLALRGNLQENAPQRFNAAATLHALDPAALLQDSPGGDINGELELSGKLGGPPRVEARFKLANSRLAGAPLQGEGHLRLAGEILEQLEVELQAGNNRLHSSGAFGAPGRHLEVRIDAPRLAYGPLQGDLNARLQLGGSPAALSLEGQLTSTRLSLPGTLRLEGLNGEFHLAEDPTHPQRARLSLTRGLVDGQPRLANAQLQLAGLRRLHQWDISAQLPDLDATLALRLIGGLATERLDWRGQLSQLSVGSPVPGRQLRLHQGTPLQLARNHFSLGPAALDWGEATVQLDELAFTPGRWSSKGALSHWQPAGLAPQRLQGDLRLAGHWQLAWDGALSAQAVLQRETGDLRVGTGEDAIALGLDKLGLTAHGNEHGLRLDLQARGGRLGHINGWLQLPPLANAPDATTPMQGQLRLDLADPGWIAPLLRPDSSFSGHLLATLDISGQLGKPHLTGELQGQQLAISDPASGLQLQEGRLEARFDGRHLQLDELRFSAPPPSPPRAFLQRLGRPLPAHPASLRARGELDPLNDALQLELTVESLPVLQQADRWLQLSGQTRVSLDTTGLKVGGGLTVDAAWWQLAAPGRPSLSDDVIVIRGDSPASRPLPVALDLAVQLGPAVYFSGAGLESRLAGELRLQARDLASIHASGSIRSEDGRFSAYGQELEVRRGLLNFQGLVDNPGLNILAVRPGLSVEAGVQVAGTARTPHITVVSEPRLPDAEALSWLILGHGSDGSTGGEQALLLNAAAKLLGNGEGSEGLARHLKETFHLDELSLSEGNVSGNTSNLPTSQVASAGGFAGNPVGSSTSGQIVTLGKRLSRNLYLAIEQSVSATGSAVRLTLQLSRHLSVVGRAGSDNALDAYYSIQFGR